jgi:hypothetical protein
VLLSGESTGRDRDRARCPTQQALPDAAREHSSDLSATAGSDDDQVGLLFFGVFVEGTRGRAPCNRAVETGPYEVGASELARRGLIEPFIQLLER